MNTRKLVFGALCWAIPAGAWAQTAPDLAQEYQRLSWQVSGRDPVLVSDQRPAMTPDFGEDKELIGARVKSVIREATSSGSILRTTFDNQVTVAIEYDAQGNFKRRSVIIPGQDPIEIDESVVARQERFAHSGVHLGEAGNYSIKVFRRNLDILIIDELVKGGLPDPAKSISIYKSGIVRYHKRARFFFDLIGDPDTQISVYRTPENVWLVLTRYSNRRGSAYHLEVMDSNSKTGAFECGNHFCARGITRMFLTGAAKSLDELDLDKPGQYHDYLFDFE